MRDLKHVFRLFLILAILAVGGVILAGGVRAQSYFGVTVAPNRESVYVRIAPSLGREVIGSLALGQSVPATGRSPNGQWFRIDFFGQEGWIGRVVVTVSGNPDVLPVGDPATMPFDLGDGPRAGPSGASGPATIRLPESGLRLRAGPSQAYFFMAGVPRYEVMSATGRSPDGQWLQVNFRGTLGWVANQYIEWQSGSIEALPVWGIVANGPPVVMPDGGGPSATRDALMTAMLLHIDLSTNRLDILEGIWRSIAAGAPRPCAFTLGHPQPYIPRPEDLSAYPELDPVIAALNQGLEETGRAIDVWETWCELHANEYPVPPEIVNSGLEGVYNARRGYESARQLIFALGLVPTATPPPPGFTPAPAVPTVTISAPNLPDLMAFGLQNNRVTFTTQFTHPELGCAWQGLGGQVFVGTTLWMRRRSAAARGKDWAGRCSGCRARRCAA